MDPSAIYPLCKRDVLVVAPLLGWNHAGKLLSYALNAKRILEYGSGGSTLWLAQMCPDAKIVSVEHDGDWHLRVRNAYGAMFREGIGQDNLIIILGRPLDHYVYNQTVLDTKPYDLIFIDGAHEQRTPCLKAAAELLTPGGVVILDNSEEPAYQEGKAFLLSQPGMVLIEETEDETWDANRSRRKLWIAQKSESSPA